VVVQRNGLELPAGLTPEGWQEIGNRLAAASAGVLFMWGDFFAYAESAFEFRKSHDGKRVLADGIYEEWAPRSGFDAITLRDAKYICQAVNLSRRREGVSFSHLREIVGRAPKGQVDYWQDRVIREKLTQKALRVELKKSFAKHADAPVTPAVSFSNDVQAFVDAYRRSSPSWNPRFKQEMAKLFLPVYRDLESIFREL
jgi:hypothetical protein